MTYCPLKALMLGKTYHFADDIWNQLMVWGIFKTYRFRNGVLHAINSLVYTLNCCIKIFTERWTSLWKVKINLLNGITTTLLQLCDIEQFSIVGYLFTVICKACVKMIYEHTEQLQRHNFCCHTQHFLGNLWSHMPHCLWGNK